MQTTTNFGLRILEGSDSFRYADLQFNFDKWNDILRAMYPVGYVYESTSETNPLADIPNTTWRKIEGVFLFACDQDHPAGTTGGEETHTLTLNEMPSHTHAISDHTHSFTIEGQTTGEFTFTHDHSVDFLKGYPVSITSVSSLSAKYVSHALYRSDSTSSSSGDHTHDVTFPSVTTTDCSVSASGTTGGETSHNNMPPYKVVNIWERIS